MSRIASDAVALAADGDGGIGPDGKFHFRFVEPPRSGFKPHRLFGLAARLLARSNAVEDRPSHFRDGAFSEVGTTRHAVKVR